jgi:predicted phosphohydrolase
MHVFGPQWLNHHAKISTHWDDLVRPDDLVLIPGDISWAMHLEDAIADFEWIAKRPGTKVMIKGNHDYWWSSISKVRKALPNSLHAIYNDAFLWNDVAIGGARLWDTPEYEFSSCIEMRPAYEKAKPKEKQSDEDEKIFERELLRLTMSHQAMKNDASLKIMMTHYPPIGLDLQESRVSKLMEEWQIHHVIFGHLHNVKPSLALFGEKSGIHYHLTSCDYLNFTLLKVL